MRYKKIMVLAIFLVSLLAISAVSAAGNVTSDVVGLEETTVDVVKETTDEVVSVENNNPVVSANESDWGTFDDLAKEISAVGEDGVLNLTKDYKYVNGSTEGIQINKSIDINGNNHVLDGNKLSRIFYINAKNINLKNISFINAKSENGSAIYCQNGIGNISSCKFINCTVNYEPFDLGKIKGAGIYLSKLTNITVYKCDFLNNEAFEGAAISSDTYVKIFNCNFIENSGYAGMVEIHDGVIANCTFINNSGGQGGAIYIHRGKIKDSIFIKNHAYDDGGAIYAANNVLISNCTFDSNYADEPLFHNGRHWGGAIFTYNSNNITICKCNFTNNYGSTIDDSYGQNTPGYGGAICGCYESYGYDNVYYLIEDCNFVNNSALNGGAICWYSSTVASGIFNILNCTFSNNSANSGNSIWSNLNSSGLINNSFFTPEYNNVVIPDNFEFIRTDSKIEYCNYSFEFKNPKTISILLKSTNGDILPHSNLNFTLVKEENITSFVLSADENGIVELYYELVNLTVGDWEMNIKFDGNDNYAPCNATATITVLPPSSSLTIDDVNGTVGHDVTLVANVNSTLAVNEGIVSFFDGETNIGDANVVGGVATLTYTPSVAGEHTITAIFNSDNYGSSNDTALLTVSKADVELSIDYIADVYFTNPSNFAVNVNSNYKPVNEGKIKYYVNNELVGTVDVYEGNANFNYVTGTAGSFTLTTAYEETDNYFAKNASASFNVNKMPTTLSGESVIFDEESYKTFTTELKDNNNNGVGDQPVKIEVIKYSGESATFNGISDANGITIYDVGRLAGGMWYVTGIYAGNNNYINSRFADKFIVVRMNTTTEIAEIDNPKVNHNYKLKANIHDENGKLVKEGIVQFYLDGVDIGSIDLSKNQGHQDALSEGVLGAVNPMFEFVVGAADVSDLYINYVPTKAGKHTLTAVYEGTTIYKASNSTTSFDVSNSNTVETSIVASDVSTVYNGGKYIVIQLKDVNGKAVSGVKVTVVLGGKTYTPTTKNGQAKVSTNGLAPVKTYKATITFKGNSKYDKSTITAKVVVKKATPKLTAKAKTFKKSVKTKKYSITLKTNQNKVMKNTKVTLKVNGKTYSATTNAKGQATFKITKLTKKGKFTAVVKFAGNKYYNAKTVKPKITIK